MEGKRDDARFSMYLDSKEVADLREEEVVGGIGKE